MYVYAFVCVYVLVYVYAYVYAHTQRIDVHSRLKYAYT